MANSKFEYVRNFETTDALMPNTWIVVRIDGRGFTKYIQPCWTMRIKLTGLRMCAKYAFEKPNDRRALDLMNTAAKAVVTELPDITIAYGVSDEYSFWSLIQVKGLDNKEAEKRLAVSCQCLWTQNKLTHWQGTYAADKNEILFSECSINYNNEPEIYKKGSVIFRDYELVDPDSHNITQTIDSQAEPTQQSKTQKEKDKKSRAKARVVVEHVDIIKDDFWDRRPWLLSNKPGKIPKQT
ncbi:hypothetical protein HYE68_006161 [Fusarium pseudograminearum]|nr:hypothetical protein HYE68_006161 [Fusarium pseudograminearum]